MSGDEGGEKTEKPTQQRRDKARREGQVAVSQELGVATAVLSLCIAIGAILPWTMGIHLEATRGLLSPAMGETLTNERAAAAIRSLAWRAAVIASPVALLAMAMGTLANLVQVGVFLNWENLGPKWNRLDPMNWLKRVFSAELPVSLLKSAFKGLGVVAVAILGVYDLPERLWRLAGIPPGALAGEVQEIALAVAYRVLAALIILAALDVLWTRHRHEKKLMMSRQEIKDELKDSEGNPQVRGAMRRRMNEVANKRMKQALSEATVVTTNPTHYAVALRYWQGQDESPVVVVKGADYKAQRIKKYAMEFGIPIVEDKPLARSLYALVPEGRCVPVDLYRGVARLLAIVYRRRGYLRRGDER